MSRHGEALIHRAVAHGDDLVVEAALVDGLDGSFVARKANASIWSRLMSHFSAIISAPRNWETSWVPYRSTHPSNR